MIRLNHEWINGVDIAISKFKANIQHVEYTLSRVKSKQYLIKKLLENGISYKILNCGVGISCITTDTSVCPLCKRKIDERIKKS